MKTENAFSIGAFLNRPDHLTRAAEEVANGDDINSIADAATLRQSMPVTQVEVEGKDRIEDLADPRNAQDVSNGITRAVIALRAHR